MKLTDEQVKKLKSIEIEIFCEFIHICQKLNLRYYLLEGTLLGAIRHQGFIPWDDDIDVGMPREDYEMFAKQGVKLLPKHLFLQNIQSDPGYLMCFSKLRNSNTTFLETTAHNLKINHGVFIDIFPLDYYPDDIKKQKVIDRKKRLYDLRIACEFDLPNLKTIKYRLAVGILKLLYPSVKKVLLKRERVIRSAPQGVMLANFGSAWGKKEIVPAAWYGEGIEVVFEGLRVNAPIDYEKWLTQVYGDYMHLPPAEKRIAHHYVDVVDFDRPYTDYWGEKV